MASNLIVMISLAAWLVGAGAAAPGGSIRVDLVARSDSVFMGTLFLGSPESQPVRLVFDTGSEFLAVTSNFCFDGPDRSRFDKLNAFFQQGKLEAERCHTKGFDVNLALNAHLVNTNKQMLSYGTASFNGFLFEDSVCLSALPDPVDHPELASNHSAQCSQMKFLTAYSFSGLSKYADGILGLSPSGNVSHSLIMQLYNSGAIAKPTIAFDLSPPSSGAASYAYFGAWDLARVKGGQLFALENQPNDLKMWATKAHSISLGNETKIYSGLAVIDTGTSQVTVPKGAFEFLVQQW